MGVIFKFNTGGFAEGNSTATGNYSHAEGAKYENNRNTESAGQASHAEGASTYAKADGSHAEGILNVAGRFSDEISTAAQELGISGTPQELVAKLLGYGAHAEGMNNKALGSCSHSEGNATKALANSTHAEGDTTIAFGEASHAEGYNTQAKGNQSHAEGSSTIATGNSSHAEGVSTTASGSFSHAEGSHTEASGRDSHAEGAYNKAIGIASHAEGVNNTAPNEAQHVSGKYATIDNTGTAIFQVGIGNDTGDRKDALRIKTDGDIIIQQDNQEIVLQDKLDSLQKQIDGETSSWLFEGEPTTTNKPANEWTGIDENGATFDYRQRHEGDTYTNIENAILLDSSMWEQGGIVWNTDASASGGDQASDCFVRTKYINVEGCSQLLRLGSDYYYTIFYYDSNKTCLKVDEVTAKGLAIPIHLQILKTVSNQNVVYFRLRLGYKKKGTQYLKFNVGNAVDAKAMINPTAGQSWRWCNTDDKYGTGWHWHKIADSDAVKALTIANGVREDFDNLEIGGVNLLPNTRTGVGFTFQPQPNTGSSGEFDSTNKWFKFTCPQNAITSSQTDTILLKSPTVQLTPGTYTVSCQYRCTQPLNRMQVLCLPVTSEGSYDMNTQSFAFEVKSSSPVTYFQKYSATFNISEDLRDVYGWIIRIDLDHRGSHGNSQELYVKDIKLEKGHKATDWTPTLEGEYLPLSGGTMTGAIDFEWNGSDIHNILTWRKQGILQLDETTNQNKLYLGTAAKLPLTVHELTTNGNILPSISAPQIGQMAALLPGESEPTYISLGSTDKYFDMVYAREFKGLADNALKLYTYGTGIIQRQPYAVEKGSASTPVYFKDGVPVTCTGTLPTNQQITNWNLAYGWGDHSEVGYVTSSGVTAVYVGAGLYLEGLDEQHPTSLFSITSKGRITLKLGNDTQSDYYSNSDYELVEERQYGVGLDAGGDLSVNVPWTDTYHKHTAGTGISISNTTANGDSSHNVTISLLKATTSAIGGIKIGYSKNGQNYPVELNTEGQAYVNVPWNDAPQQSLDGYLTIAAAEKAYVKKGGDTMTGALHAPAFYETSDIRKKEIKSDLSLDKCYDLIDKCQTVIYSLKDQTKEQVGMIAQEIEEFFPEVVVTDEEGFKSLAYDRLVVICFKVLKDVIKRLEKLES